MKPLILAIHVIPGASRNEIQGWVETASDDKTAAHALKVKLQAPAQDGKANKALIAFLARTLAVAKKDIVLLSGETSRHKRLQINGETSAACLLQRLGFPD